MASVAIMAGGAVPNAVAFIGGDYLSRFFAIMIQRLPSKKKKLLRLTKPLMPNMKKKEQSCLTGPKHSMKSKSRSNKTSYEH